MHEVFFYEAFEEEAAGLRALMPPRVRAGYDGRTPQEAGHREPPAPLISTRTQSLIPPEWAGRLRGILTRSTGYDHVQRYRRESGVAVAAGYLPLYCVRAVAEHAMLLWTALLRKLPSQVAHFGHFHRDGLTGGECAGRRLLVVGVGHIGAEVYRIGQALGMDARGVDIVRRHESVRYASPEDGIPWAQVIVCSMNLTRDNADYFSYDRLRAAAPGCVFVNVARGEMSPATGLLRLLREGRLGGVGLDVYEREGDLAAALRQGRVAAGDEAQAVLELARRPDAILTPHNAFNTAESVEAKVRYSVQETVRFLDTGAFSWPAPDDA